MIHTIRRKTERIAMVYNKEGLAVLILRNRQWRLEQFIVFGIGGKTRKAAMDGFDQMLSHEESIILKSLYSRFSRWHSFQRVLYRRKAGFLSEDQRKACLREELL